ncbi:MAG: thioesterase family protein [Pseudomonadota bacterium]
MIGPIETVRDTVNSWECDENDHINIQFYAKRFDDAVRSFLVQASWQVPHRSIRLIRYHAELRGGEPVHGTSGLVALEGGQVGIEHRLYASHRPDLSAPTLSATALDVLPDVQRADLSAFSLPQVSKDVLPKSGAFSSSGAVHVGGLDKLEATYRGVVPPNAFSAEAESADGARLSDRYLVGVISDAANHAWGLAGAPDPWLQARGLGRAAVELQLTYLTRPQAGDVVEARTAIRAFSNKTVSYRHLIINRMTDTLIAQADITSLMLDLTSRKATPWPEDRKAQLRQGVAMFEKAYSA